MMKNWLNKKIVFSINLIDTVLVVTAFSLAYVRLGLKEALLFTGLIFGILIRPNSFTITCFAIASLLAVVAVVFMGINGKGDLLTMLAFFFLFIAVIMAIFDLQKKSS